VRVWLREEGVGVGGRKDLKDPKRPPTSSMTFGTFGSTHESTSTRDRLLLRYRAARALTLSRLEVAEVVRPEVKHP
jgi:hypothetical protein